MCNVTSNRGMVGVIVSRTSLWDLRPQKIFKVLQQKILQFSAIFRIWGGGWPLTAITLLMDGWMDGAQVLLFTIWHTPRAYTLISRVWVENLLKMR